MNIKRINLQIKSLFTKFTNLTLKSRWRKRNNHNDTKLIRNIDLEKIEVGKYSYGPLNVISWKCKDEKLIIGNFVSIAPNVKFLLGGNHTIDTILTYPCKVKVENLKEKAVTRGKIIIEDDVWIGMDAMILSGVKIGKGAVIGARTVIAKDVPPFAVVIGNPQKIIKYRFSQEVINTLLKIDYSKLNMEYIKNHFEYFNRKLKVEDLAVVMKDLKL